jgi:hypothetical protein
LAFAAVSPTTGRAAVITLTGGDAADASDGIGYSVSTADVVYAYRMTSSHNGAGLDLSPHTYNGVTFQPFDLQGTSLHTTSNITAQGPVTVTDGFFYGDGVHDNNGLGGVHTANDTALSDIAKYQSFAASTYNGNHGTETLTLGGLQAGVRYQVDLIVGVAPTGGASVYHYTITGTSSFSDTVPTSDVTPYGTTHSTSQYGLGYNVRESVVADALGTITVVANDTSTPNDNAQINAFSVTALPEPTGAIAVMFGGTLLSLRRRRCIA